MEAPRQVVEAEYVKMLLLVLITLIKKKKKKKKHSAANFQLLRKKTCEKRPDGKVAFV